MKNKIILSTLFFTVLTFSQVKIGDNSTSIDTSSLLELESTDKGMLLPRIVLTNVATAAPLAGHVKGMLIYNTAAAVTGVLGNAEGIYQNNGTRWIQISGADNTDDAFVNNTTLGRVELGSKSDGTVRDADKGFFVDDNGGVGFGLGNNPLNSTPYNTNKFEMWSENGTSDMLIRAAGGGSPIINLIGHNGTLATPTTTASGFATGGISFVGYDTTLSSNARILSFVDGATAPSSVPGNIQFWTTRIGATDPTFSMIVKNDGKVGIGTSTPLGQLHVSSTQTNTGGNTFGANIQTTHNLNTVAGAGYGQYINTSTNTPSGITASAAYGLRNDITINGSGDVTNSYGISNNITKNGSGAVSNLRGLFSSVIAAGTGINNLYGVNINSVLQATGAATTTYGIFNQQNVAAGFVGTSITGTYSSQILASNFTTATGLVITQSGTGVITNSYGINIGNLIGTNKYAIYQTDATARNYFNGNVGIGTNAPAEKLDVAGGNIRIDNNKQLLGKTASGASNITIAKIDGSDILNLGNGTIQTGVGGAGTTMFVQGSNGNTGLGTVSPTDKLHVVGSIRMVDGNEALGKVMVSDTAGKGIWTTLNTNAVNTTATAAGTTAATVTGGNLEFLQNSAGVILLDSAGVKWKVTISTTGQLTIEKAL